MNIGAMRGMPRRGERWIKAAGTTALVASVVLGMVGCDSHSADAPQAAKRPASQVPGRLELQAASLKMLDIQPVPDAQQGITVWAPARIAFRDDRVAAVGAPVSARIVEVHAHVGDVVRAGDPLATLASPEALRIRHELAAARSALSVAQAEAKRHHLMIDKGVGSEVEALAADARLREATQEVDRAQRTAALLGGGDNDRIVLRAPRAGVVAARAATPGAAVEPTGEAVFMVGDPSAVWVVADVFESDLNGLKEGAATQVLLPSSSDPLTGKVQRVGATLNDETRRAHVYIVLDQPASGLRPGTLARVGLQVQGRQGVAIPLSAVLIKDEHRSVVYVQHDETTFEAREVTLGAPSRGMVPVLGGLKVGERIVVRGGLLLDGAAAQML